MAQIGSFVPAEKAKIGVVDRIFTRVGASDDLASGQSTFMVEMTEVANILRNATAKSLLILDEIGRGTSTFDGLSIAWAVIEHISNTKLLGAKTLFATHYHELTELEGKIPGVNNYCIAVKERGDDIVFLRKIVKGGADKSYGIQVAKLAGVPDSVLDRAKELVDELDPSDESAITNSQYIEGYSNVQVYTKKGMTDTSYVVFAAYDHKYVGYDTLLPGISYLYVDTKEDGSLYIVADPNEEQLAYISEQLEDAKVQELLNSTQASYDEKLASDEALSKYLSELGVEGSAVMEAAEGAQITVKSNCNIRKEPSQDAESIGKLVGGQTVTKTGEDGDWIKIEFEGQTGYVRGDMFQ